MMRPVRKRETYPVLCRVFFQRGAVSLLPWQGADPALPVSIRTITLPQQFKYEPSKIGALSPTRSFPSLQPAVRERQDGLSVFEIFRSEVVQFTSMLSGGGDWHWRLTSPLGTILAGCGGYHNRATCLAAVEALRAEAGSARLTERINATAAFQQSNWQKN